MISKIIARVIVVVVHRWGEGRRTGRRLTESPSFVEGRKGVVSIKAVGRLAKMRLERFGCSQPSYRRISATFLLLLAYACKY